MKKSVLLTVPVIISTAVSCMAAKPAPEEKPNIILINIDDLGWSDIACFGSDYYQTPNIDRLTANGMKFTNAYAAAANCAPSRACLISGQYGPRHGVYTVNGSERGNPKTRKLIPTKNTLHLKNDNITIGGALKAGGYKTITLGKWHVGEDPTKQGFDINIGGTSAGGPYTGGYFSPYKFPNCSQDKKGEHLPYRLTDEALKFIENNKEKPFFVYFPYYSVHTPIQGDPKLTKKYKGLTPTKAHKNPQYAAMIESVDTNIGRITAKLDELNLSENTLVIFTSDNGGVWNISKQWPLRAGKGAYYEGGIRVPTFAYWPGKIKSGSECNVPISGIDFYPTFLDIAGVEKPKGKVLDGESIKPLLLGQGEFEEDRALFWHFPIYLQGGNKECTDTAFRTRPGSVVRKGDWKLHEYFENGHFELYNLKDDVGEKQDLAKKNPEKVKELHALLKKWRKETNAPVPSKLNPKYDEKFDMKKRGK